MDFHKQKEGGQSGLKTLKRSKTVTLSFFFFCEFHHIIYTSISFHIHFFFSCCTTKVYKKKKCMLSTLFLFPSSLRRLGRGM